MQILLDTCVSRRAYQELQAAGYDVIWTAMWPEDPGDEEILAFAYREGRVLVTLDRDFGELVIVYGKSHAGIVRLNKTPTAWKQAQLCLRVLSLYDKELAAGAIVTAEPGRVRVRPADTP